MTAAKIPCLKYTRDAGKPPVHIAGWPGTPSHEAHLCTCGFTEAQHEPALRAVLRGESPESMPDGRGGFMRRPRWGNLAAEGSGRYA